MADDTFPVYVSAGVELAIKRAERELKKADLMAQGASKQIKKSFPDWQVRYEALADSPAWGLIKKSDEWAADLIVIGARGHSVLGGRLVLGSVSQRVLYEARCSVRIAREASEEGFVNEVFLVEVRREHDELLERHFELLASVQRQVVNALLKWNNPAIK